MKFLQITAYFLFVSLFSHPFAVQAYPHGIEQLKLNQIAEKSLQYAISTQITTTNHQHYVYGEFPTTIKSTLVPVLAGVGKLFGEDQEASAFTTASVLNVLAQTYLDFPYLQKTSSPISEIPKVIQNGVQSFERYSAGETYNFYPPYVDKNGHKQRRPIDMKVLPFWFGFTNIPNDADTSSVALTAQLFNAKINHTNFKISQKALNEFSRYRDIDRTPMFYNKSQNRSHTGAFMTWLYDENNPNMPRFYFAGPDKGERIPFNRNDVDCIVNANVLKMSSLSGQSNFSGTKESCSMINDMIARDEHASCGIYYPNTFNLAFAMASAEKAGNKCLTDDSKKLMIDKILSLQDGYTGAWTNDKNIWQDPILSTAFALSALIHYGNKNETRIYYALLYGTHYLLKELQTDNNIYKWEADNFFTATAIARSLVMWRSEAYTNAIVSHVLLKMHEMYPQYNAHHYLKLDFNTEK